MNLLQAAIYARVSSAQQVGAQTIVSQVAALQARVAADGLPLPAALQFVDAGYSGATLVRPALERLRDLAAAGGIDRLYVHSPDRLARKYAYQALLLDEFQRAGVAVVFLNRAVGETPEDELLLQVQGMVAEYERAKILERSRRGKRHAAHSGAVSVLSAAPYGYRYIGKADGGGSARYEIVLEEAQVVREIFMWVGQERATIGAVCRRLAEAGTLTRRGKTVWDRTTVWGLLKNPAYIGTAAFGKTRAAPLQPRLRAQRGRNVQPRRAVSTQDVPPEEWITIPVPALISATLFAAVQEQLQENRRRARQGQRGARYLLQGLVTCAQCGYAYYGKAVSVSAAKGTPRAYAYYRCVGTDAYRFGGERVCANTQVRTDLLDAAVWEQVRGLLEQPQQLADEYRHRLEARPAQTHERTATEAQVRKLQQGVARLIDSYAEGLIEKGEFEPRITRLRQRIAHLEEQARQMADAVALESEMRLIVGRLEEFAVQVCDGLAAADWTTRRDLMRMLVKRVEVNHDAVKVVFRVESTARLSPPGSGDLTDCWRRDDPTLRCAFRGFMEDSCIHVSRFQPLPDQFPSGYFPDGFQQVVVVDVVECPRDVRIHHPFLPVVRSDECAGFCDGIMGTASGAEPVTTSLESGFPDGFKGVLDPRLEGAVSHHRDAERSECAVGFRDGHPFGRFRPPRLVFHQLVYQLCAVGGVEGHLLVNSCRLLAVVHLGHPPNTDECVRV